MSSVTAPLRNATPRGDWRDKLARFGLIGKGILHLAIGVLALQLAFGSKETNEAVSQSGAIDWIGELPAGTLLLWLVGLSLLALAAWRVVTFFAGDPVQDDDAPHRISYAAKAVIYGGLGLAAVNSALSGGSGSSGSGSGGSGSGGSGSGGTEQAAGTIAALPGGRFWLFAIGIGTIGVAGYLAYQHAYKAEFTQRLDVGEGDEAATFGKVGYGLRSLAYAPIGTLFVQAGFTGQEDQAKGLSGALSGRRVVGYVVPARRRPRVRVLRRVLLLRVEAPPHRLSRSPRSLLELLGCASQLRVVTWRVPRWRARGGACSRPCRWRLGRWCRRSPHPSAPCRRPASASRGRSARPRRSSDRRGPRPPR